MNKQEAAAKLQEKIDRVTSDLERAFESLQEMKDLCNKEDETWDLEEEGLVSFCKLKDIMDDIGWSSSSLWC